MRLLRLTEPAGEGITTEGGAFLSPAVPLQDMSNPEVLLRKRLPGAMRAPYPVPFPDVKFSAVLIVLRNSQNAWEVLFTRRSRQLADHRGQIAFPGGRAETGDSGPPQTALREASEEVGIPPDAIRPLGILDPVDTSSGFRIWPVVGTIAPSVHPQGESPEVAEVFWIPLSWLKTEGRWEWRNVTAGKIHREQKAVFFEAYHGHVVWGATAMILVRLLDILQEGGDG